MSSYQKRSLDRLELPAVLSQLENACACELGRARARELAPTNDNAVARARMALTSEAREFTQIVRHPPFGGLTDVASSVQAASIGSLLDAAPLLAIGRASGRRAPFARGDTRYRTGTRRAISAIIGFGRTNYSAK